MKNWTVLIYANGNNELEPEVYQRFIELRNEIVDQSYKIIVQISRANLKLVRSLRNNIAKNINQDWNGVRRYRIKNNQASLLEDVGDINMADPSSLVDFVTWGMDNYSNSRIMVIVSGHGAGFVGVMTDYTKKKPYMMDIFGLTSSLYKIKDNTKKYIDCLVLDACFMNMVEVWDEIASIPNKPVRYLIAPSKNIEIKGLSYSSIINSIKYKITLRKSLIETIKTINSTNKKNQLILVKLSMNYFYKLKKEISNIGEFITKRSINLRGLLNNWCLYKPIEPLISLLDLKEIINIDSPGIFRKKSLEKTLKNILVYPPISSIYNRLNQGPSIYFPFHLNQYIDLRYYYDSLTFSKDNSWLKVISSSEGNIMFNRYEKNYKELPAPMEIPINYVVANIMDINPNISSGELLNIIKNMGWS